MYLGAVLFSQDVRSSATGKPASRVGGEGVGPVGLVIVGSILTPAQNSAGPATPPIISSASSCLLISTCGR